ncbi:hypothetical protein ACLB0R_03060 [Sphingomonas sp. GlSt437]|uniref:hypothetical protein n=1 Tax=Sphingomonas sp. GlSt437 TaxID=3389970 RepID=UPI003A8522F2
MTMKSLSLSLLLGLMAVAPAAGAQRHRDTDEVFDAARAGRILPLPEIERRVLPSMGNAQYLGVDVDLDSGIYTLKFLRNGLVIWVQVDGRSGQIIGRSAR